MKTFDARDLNLSLNPAELKPLFKIKPHIHGAAILYNWLIIAAAIYLGITYFNPSTYILALIVIGARMHALAILMHDATHYRFLKNRKWIDFVTNVTTMFPLFLTIEQYRRNHLAHHKNLNTDSDPDWVSKLGRREFTFPQSKLDFLWTIFTYFILYQGIRDAIWFVSRFDLLGNKKKERTKNESPIPKLLFFATLITVLTLLGGWKYFLLFWIVPYLSTFLMFQYIRSISEHFGELEYDHLLNASRTVKTNALEKFIIAPHNVGYHIEHHLYPGVPYYNLPKLHELLMQTEEYKSKAHLTRGYMSGLMKELV